ncbi:acyl-CoA dehydrogenase family protein [Ammoniphilus sp. 3BR4]|uniref:acyl-CoA dehydrogenase family protein n=1 Tax=Ammoniphilus sp. 3BR4 TaxID=3158265 RepID=UPI0034660E15
MTLKQDIIKGGSFLLRETGTEDVFTPEDFTEEHKMIAKMTADFVEGEVFPHDEEIEHQNLDVIVSLLKQAGELGLLGADIPEEYGGMGLDKVSSLLIGENFTRSSSLAVSHTCHVGIGSLPIAMFGTEQQKKRYLPGLATGELLGAYCLTEPSSGSDALGAKATAVLSEDGSHYILNGTKQFITNAGFADIFIVYAKIDGEKFTAFIVEKDYPGVSTGAEEKKMGIKGSSTRPLILEDCRVPIENVLGDIGKGHVIAFNILNIGRYKLGGNCVGASKWATELSVKYAKERKQFGKPISDFPLIQKKLADMAVRTYAAESMVYRTAGLIEEGLAGLEKDSPEIGSQVGDAIAEYALECSINKVFGSECLDFVADEGVQIHGGYGFTQEYKIERIYRDSRINRIFEGTNEINRLLIPGTLLKKAAKGELPFMSAVQNLQKELASYASPSIEDDEPLALEKAIIETAKKIFLLVCGEAVMKYRQRLDKEQEILDALADIIIEIFAMESAWLRTVKAVNKDGKEKAQHKADMTKVYVQEAFVRIENRAREALAAMDNESGQYMLKQMAAFSFMNTISLKRRIAAQIIEAEKYVS